MPSDLYFTYGKPGWLTRVLYQREIRQRGRAIYLHVSTPIWKAGDDPFCKTYAKVLVRSRMLLLRMGIAYLKDFNAK